MTLTMAVTHQHTRTSAVVMMMLIKVLTVMSCLLSRRTTTSTAFLLRPSTSCRRLVGATSSSILPISSSSSPSPSSLTSPSIPIYCNVRKRLLESGCLTSLHHHRHSYSRNRSSRSNVVNTHSSSSTSTSANNSDRDNSSDDDVESVSSFVSPLNEYISAAVLILIDIVFRKAFVKAQLTFPSSLAACCVLFTSLLLCPQRSLANAAVRIIFQPGASLLAKWLPVFFVPSLVVLPLMSVNDALGGSGEVAKVILVLIGGFFWTLLTTAMSVVSIRKHFASSSPPPPDKDNNNKEVMNEKIVKHEKKDASISKNDLQEVALQAVRYAEARRSDGGSARGPFSNQLYEGLMTVTAGSGVAAILFSLLRLRFLSVPMTTLYLLSATLGSFVFGTRLPKKFCQVVHPLITCGCLTWVASAVLAKLMPLGVASTSSFRAMLKAYTKGRLTWTGGAGDLLLFMLGPAVVSLSISMYDKRQLMRQNLKEVATAVGVSTVGGIFGTALLVRLLQIANPSLRLALLSRNITSPLAMAIAAILGADVSLAVSAVVLTGLFGANFGASILTAFGIHDPVARGLGIGAAAHGLGTASFVNEKDAFPFAAIAMALTATAATVTVSVPLLRRIILQLALG